MKATKRNWFKRVFALALMLTLVFGMNVTTAYAAPGDETYQVKDTTTGNMVNIDPETYDPIGNGMASGTVIVYKYVETPVQAVQGAVLEHKATYTFTIDKGEVVKADMETTTGTSVTVNPFKFLQLSGTQQAADAINNIKDLTNVHPDLDAAQGTLEPIIEIVNTVIGILATAILILIGLFTAIDILYLEVPTFHNSMDQKAMEKGQTNKSGGVKAKIVSEDASQAYQEATETGKNVLIVYLKKRIVAYIAVAIVLYMLLSGNLSLIVEVVLKMLNGVFGWVEEYSSTM